MANAWIVNPLPPVGAEAIGSVQLGATTNAFNDHAGVILQVQTDSGQTGGLRFDLGRDSLFDTILVFGLELLPQSGTLTPAWATAAQGNFTGTSTSGNPVAAYAGSILPVGGKGVSIIALEAPVSARYVRLAYAAGSSSAAVRMARVAIGRRIELERNFNAIQLGVRDLGSLDFSARAVLMRRRAKKLRTLGLTFSSLYKDEVEASIRPLIEQVGNTEMIALVTDPADDPERQNRCYFGPLVGDLSVSWRKADRWEHRANLVSIF